MGHRVSIGWYRLIQDGIGDSLGRYWLIHVGTGSVEGGTGWYLVVLVQHGAVLIGTWWYWVSIGGSDDCDNIHYIPIPRIFPNLLGAQGNLLSR